MNNDDETLESILPQTQEADNQSLEVELDWEAYFNEFCNKHGKYPVVFGKDKQLFLFPDGWTYDAAHYEGPEFPPPKDKYQLARLQFYYWSRRYRIVKLEFINIESDLNYLVDIQSSKSQPLHQTVEYQSDDGKINRTTKQLDLSMMRKRKIWLEQDMKNSKTMIEIYQNRLKQLKKEHDETTRGVEV